MLERRYRQKPEKAELEESHDATQVKMEVRIDTCRVVGFEVGHKRTYREEDRDTILAMDRMRWQSRTEELDPFLGAPIPQPLIPLSFPSALPYHPPLPFPTSLFCRRINGTASGKAAKPSRTVRSLKDEENSFPEKV